mgnify:CR=1 FL=1
MQNTRVGGDKQPSDREADRREERRVNTNDLRFQTVAGGAQEHGLICNISTWGLCAMGLTEQVLAQPGRFEIVVDEQGVSYRLSIELRWHVALQSGVQIGAYIQNPDEAWRNLVSRRGSFSFG